MGKAMIAADGKVTAEETMGLAIEVAKFGIPADKLKDLLANSDTMSAEESIIMVANFNQEQKKYATGFLAMLMNADGDIDDSEVKLWKVISTLCGFPTMTIQQAIEFWMNN